MNPNIEFYKGLISQFGREQSLKHHRTIKQFVDYYDQKKLFIDYEDASLMLLSDQDFQEIPESICINIFNTYLYVRKDRITNNCYGIASLAVHTKSADGVLKASEGVDDFTDHYDHALNYLSLLDGTFIAFDLTAGVNIDHGQGNFDVLAIQAHSQDALKSKLHHLYGGIWVPMTKEETNSIYTMEYPSK